MSTPPISPDLTAASSDAAAEARSQMMFLASVLGAQAPAHLPNGLAALPGPRAQGQALSGLRAYRANGLAVAHRALTAAYPTVTAMIGDEGMKVLARDLWWHRPPTVGDLARWGADLPDLIEAFAPLQAYPWLADCARLDWTVHAAATLVDAPVGTGGLHLLAEAEPDQLRLVLTPSLQQLRSHWPLAALRQAHQQLEPDTDAVAELLSTKAAQAFVTLVWRQGWQTHVSAVSVAEGQFMRCLAEGASLARALAQVQDTDFDFQHWLVRALGEAWLCRVDPL